MAGTRFKFERLTNEILIKNPIHDAGKTELNFLMLKKLI